MEPPRDQLETLLRRPGRIVEPLRGGREVVWSTLVLLRCDDQRRGAEPGGRGERVQPPGNRGGTRNRDDPGDGRTDADELARIEAEPTGVDGNACVRIALEGGIRGTEARLARLEDAIAEVRSPAWAAREPD